MSSTKTATWSALIKPAKIKLARLILALLRSEKSFRQKYIRPKNITQATKINLCSGAKKLTGYCNIDLVRNADLIIDLEKKLLPFADDSCEVVICISAINYFSRDRALAIIKDVFRVLKPGGITRFATQDLRLIAQKYVATDETFFNAKLQSGAARFAGETFGDKMNSWFYGYETAGGKHCRYVYDFESLSLLFKKAGFNIIEQKKYCESRLPQIALIDNRPEQMFFLEAIK